MKLGTAAFVLAALCGVASADDPLDRPEAFDVDRLQTPPGQAEFSFDGGGRMMLDFTDVDADALEVGQTMRMMFRIKDHDTQRGFTRYFWKAAPATTSAPNTSKES